MTFKLGFGPMSYEVVDIINNYAADNKSPLMLIASRNQIDADSGYVMTTKQLSEHLGSKSQYLMTCRDHCGPYFLDVEKHLSLADAITATKRTIAGDIENGFDLIHIDTSRCTEGYAVAEELIKFSLDLNPNIRFEFGTEENIGVAAGIQKYTDDVNFAKHFPNMDFVVAQTGSLVYEDRQAGSFESDIVRDLVSLAERNGVKLKEHNADYLDAAGIALRKQAGVHAMNIAPQLGVIQTKLLDKLATEHQLDEDWYNFRHAVLNDTKWAKWTDQESPDLRVYVAGHYHYQSKEYLKLVDAINQHTDWKAALSSEICKILDQYVEGI